MGGYVSNVEKSSDRLGRSNSLHSSEQWWAHAPASLARTFHLLTFRDPCRIRYHWGLPSELGWASLSLSPMGWLHCRKWSEYFARKVLCLFDRISLLTQESYLINHPNIYSPYYYTIFSSHYILSPSVPIQIVLCFHCSQGFSNLRTPSKNSIQVFRWKWFNQIVSF